MGDRSLGRNSGGFRKKVISLTPIINTERITIQWKVIRSDYFKIAPISINICNVQACKDHLHLHRYK